MVPKCSGYLDILAIWSDTLLDHFDSVCLQSVRFRIVRPLHPPSWNSFTIWTREKTDALLTSKIQQVEFRIDWFFRIEWKWTLRTKNDTWMHTLRFYWEFAPWRIGRRHPIEGVLSQKRRHSNDDTKQLWRLAEIKRICNESAFCSQWFGRASWWFVSLDKWGISNKHH